MTVLQTRKAQPLFKMRTAVVIKTSSINLEGGTTGRPQEARRECETACLRKGKNVLGLQEH